MPLNIDYEGTEDEQTINSARLKAFLAMTPVEVGVYVENHVTDLASAKEILVDVAMLIRLAAKEIQTLK